MEKTTQLWWSQIDDDHRSIQIIWMPFCSSACFSANNIFHLKKHFFCKSKTPLFIRHDVQTRSIHHTSRPFRACLGVSFLGDVFLILEVFWREEFQCTLAIWSVIHSSWLVFPCLTFCFASSLQFGTLEGSPMKTNVVLGSEWKKSSARQQQLENKVKTNRSNTLHCLWFRESRTCMCIFFHSCPTSFMNGFWMELKNMTISNMFQGCVPPQTTIPQQTLIGSWHLFV